MAMANPLHFIQQVRSEISKVVWPNRRETTVTTVMVFIMAMIAAMFFFSIDLLIRYGLTSALNLFN